MIYMNIKLIVNYLKVYYKKYFGFCCAVYDYLSSGQNWQQSPEISKQMFDVFSHLY
ncbi:MAG: hypothetical protein ACRDDM_04555 [Paraclostridium sp.]